ncbi:MAG: GDP-mannose 4,6-dehydratase [Deltaproteobacteria bacterium]|nr:GDP-mannose 4,6-dehydratase [Deltaproteobacteria bacterium]
MAKAMVTGTAGFIGSNLSKRLLDEGYSVLGIDSFEDYYPRWIKEKNLAGLKQNPEFKFVEDSLLELDLKYMVKEVDCVFHQAAQAGVRGSFGQFFDIYVRNNIIATQRLLEASKDSKIKKFVFASSSSVYGNTPALPAQETSVLMPFSPYGVTKMASEQLVKVYNDNFGVPSVSLRYFTVYGHGQRPDMAFHKFIKAIREDKPITVYGDGRQTRDFTCVSDIVQANMLALSAPAGMVFNVGGGSRIGLSEVIDMIGRLMKAKPKIDFKPSQKGDVKDTSADLTRAKETLGYVPQVSLEQGLLEEIEYIGQLYGEV